MQKGDKVTFRVSDVFLPNGEEVGVALSGSAELEGTVVDFSDSGASSRVFAVIEVIQKQNVIVPIDRARVIGDHRAREGEKS